LSQKGTPLGRADDCDPPASSKLQDSFIPQDVHGPQDRVLVHAEHGCKVLDQRKAIAWLRFTLSDGPTDLGSNLIVKRDGLRPVDVDKQHGPIHTSSMQLRAASVFEDPSPPPLRAVEEEMGAEALFREARRRRRLRWLIGVSVAVVVIVTATVVGTTYGVGGGGAATKHPSAKGAFPQGVHFFREASASMESTLQIGDVVQVTSDTRDLRRGDVVLITLPPRIKGPSKNAFKRIVGLPGETISSSGSTILVNGSPLSEPYIPAGQNPGPAVLTQVIPRGEYFVLGDNRTDSLDSRYFGPIPLTSIVGIATRIVSPQSRSGPVPESMSSAFG
jgi:signal peptidase I